MRSFAGLVLASVVFTACSSTSAAVPAAGDAGASCVWDQAAANAAGLTIVSAPPSIQVGDRFPSPTGCNGCGCTANGFECTHNTCSGQTEDGSCPTDTTKCPDGTTARRFGPACIFQSGVCSRTGCTAELHTCPDGGGEGRTGPFCTVPPCP